MATVNLGRIKPVFRGAYSGSTAYVVDDIVTHGNESFICIQAHGAGTQATSQTAYWSKLAAKGTDGTDVGTTITTQGDLLYRDGSGLQRLAKGTANQILQMNSGANAPEWTAKPEGKVKQIITNYSTSTTSVTSSSYVDVPSVNLTITPTSSSSKIMLTGMFTFQSHDQYYHTKIVRRVGGSDALPTGWRGDSAGSRVQSLFGNLYRHNGAGDANTNGTLGFTITDTDHGTTNAITYQLQTRNSSGSYTIYFGRSHNDSDNNNSARSPRFYWTALEIV